MADGEAGAAGAGPRAGAGAAAELTLAGVREAAARVRPYVHRTPLVTSTTLGERLGCQIFLKLELLQKTGSFKPRGALHHLMRLDAARRARGVVTVSAGNHAQGLAYAARCLGAPATVVMPAAAAASKTAAARGYGAEVVLHGDVHQAFDRAREIEQQRGLTFVHPFDHPHVVAGQGTVGLEILDELPEADLLVVPVGGGGLIAGIGLVAKALRPALRVVGVEPSGANALERSRAAGRVVRLEHIDTIADGLAPPFVGELNFAIARHCVDALVTVEDDELIDAMRFLMSRAKLMAEPAGAAAVAALLAGRLQAPAGARVVCVVSGGNLDRKLLARVLGGSD